MFGLGAGELAVIFVIALIFIGPKKIPELARSLGKGIREFQRAKDEMMSEINKDEDEDKGSSDSSEKSEKEEDPKVSYTPPESEQQKDQKKNDESSCDSQSEETSSKS